MGSIGAWQTEHDGFSRCSTIASRIDTGSPSSFSSASAGMSGGGSGGGAPSRFSSTHLPRSTGDVRFGYDVTVITLPWPSSPPRRASSSVTRRNRLP